jgi:hypothetical protein
MISDMTREQFEAWAATKGMAMHLARGASGLYVSRVTQSYMDCWMESQAGQAAEVQALRKDAQRYRWLRSRESSDDPEISVTRWTQLSPDRATGEAPRLETLDAAIDAAMSKEPSN